MNGTTDPRENGLMYGVTSTPGSIRAEWKKRLPHWMQPFLTWLIGYPYIGQKPLFQSKPWWMAIAIPAATLVLGMALSIAIVNQGGYALFALPVSWLMIVHGARSLQVHICHQGIHENMSGDPIKDRLIVEIVSTLLVVHDHDGYKADHDGIHHPRLSSDEIPDRRFTVEVMKIEMGASKQDNLRRFISALLSARIHALFLASRCKANYIASPPYRRIMAYAWLVIVLTVTTISQKWVEIVIGCVLPMTLLYQMSAMCQFVTEHLWARQRQPGQSAKEHHLSLLVNRHLGDSLPKAGLHNLEWLAGWTGWWTRLVLYHVPVRLGILVADLPVHGGHHLWPLDKRWTNAIYTYENWLIRRAGCPSSSWEAMEKYWNS